ncbi:metallophosphoesterase [Gordonia sp. X0973]|uniref:metallophosphoesterase n=1 Tax=Gordonia sp. X0973 TaxID=2742602 RepID=UPI0026575E3B|nr:metallophosphoesterase [Gordonia sp. X0973]
MPSRSSTPGVKTVVIIPDVQLPFHDRRATQRVIDFIGASQPDEVVQIGDLLDLPQPSRWTKGTRGEFEGSVQKDAEQTKRQFLDPLRKVYDGPVGAHEGNHDERARVYLEKYAPALAESNAFDMDVLLDFDGFGVELLPEFYDIAPGWLSTHGHRGGIRLSQISGSTALNAAKKFGKSVVCGHTHRLGLSHFSSGYAGRSVVDVSGMEVGNLMDMKKAQYLKGGSANWKQGFGMLHIDGNVVKPEIIPITKGAFIAGGETWRI